MELYEVNLIEPLSMDKRRKLSVHVYLTMAESEDEARRNVAREATHRLEYRVGSATPVGCNAVLWAFQTWERSAYKPDGESVADLLGEEAVSRIKRAAMEPLEER